MLLGNHLHNLDAKGRLTLPAKIRDSLASGVVITKGIGDYDYLDLYPTAAFEALVQRMKEKLPWSERDLLRYLLANASSDVPDRQGRILVPQMLREHAHLTLEGAVLIAGLHDHLEIWNPELWAAKMSGMTPKMIEEKLYQYGF
ncbi:MAG: division/cell wall cluster transcriptional repressor MraZ [Anaerolineae bacterium]